MPPPGFRLNQFFDAVAEAPATPSPPPTTKFGFHPNPNTSTLAIVIGNRTYRNGAPEVSFATEDSADVARFLVEVAGLPADAVITKNDMTGQDMASLFGRAGLRGGEGQLHKLAKFFSEVFVFYSGHGVPVVGANDTPEGYLLPIDADPALPEFLGYPLDELERQLQSLPVARAILVLDACFSGLSEGGVLLPGTSGSFGVGVGQPKPSAKVTVLSATDFETPQLAHWMPDNKNGAFTWYALKGLYGEADSDGDGRITAGELSDYAGRQVSLYVDNKVGRDQTPSLLGSRDAVLVDFGTQTARPSFQ